MVHSSKPGAPILPIFLCCARLFRCVSSLDLFSTCLLRQVYNPGDTLSSRLVQCLRRNQEHILKRESLSTARSPTLYDYLKVTELLPNLSPTHPPLSPAQPIPIRPLFCSNPSCPVSCSTTTTRQPAALESSRVPRSVSECILAQSAHPILD